MTCSPAATATTRSTAAAASTTTSARAATTRSAPVTATPSGSRAATARTRSRTTSRTSSPTASAGSTATATASRPPPTATTPTRRSARRAGGLRQRRRRGLQRARRRQPRRRRRRLRGAGRLRRLQCRGPPGRLEIRGNLVDENCDRRVSPWVPVRGRGHQPVGARRLPDAAALAGRAAGAQGRARHADLPRGPCPFKATKRRTVARDLAPVSFSRLFRRARLRAGARVTVTITRAGDDRAGSTRTGPRTARCRIRAMECLAPGETKGSPC